MSPEKDYLSLPLQTFLADLAAKSPTPGGGSVAALAGAVAACQARMVLEYSVGRAKGAEHEPRLREVLAEFGRAEQAFSCVMRSRWMKSSVLLLLTPLLLGELSAR